MPLRNIDTLHDQPQGKRQFAKQSQRQNGYNHLCVGRGEEEGDAVRQIAQASKRHQHAYGLW